MQDIRTLSRHEQENLRDCLDFALEQEKRFRISQDSDGIKWKVGEGMWTPGYGTNDNAVSFSNGNCGG